MGLTNPRWLIGILTTFGILTLISGILEGTYLGPGEVSLLQEFVRPPIFDPIKMIEWFGTLWRVLWFDYSFFYGNWNIVKYVLFWPISAGVVVSVGVVLLQAAYTAFMSFFGKVLGR